MSSKIKYGDTVCFWSTPTIKMTVVHMDSTKSKCMYYNHATGLFVMTDLVATDSLVNLGSKGE